MRRTSREVRLPLPAKKIFFFFHVYRKVWSNLYVKIITVLLKKNGQTILQMNGMSNLRRIAAQTALGLFACRSNCGLGSGHSVTNCNYLWRRI